MYCLCGTSARAVDPEARLAVSEAESDSDAACEVSTSVLICLPDTKTEHHTLSGGGYLGHT